MGNIMNKIIMATIMNRTSIKMANAPHMATGNAIHSQLSARNMVHKCLM